MNSRWLYAYVVASSLFIAACGSGESVQRTRNSALSNKTSIAYSCAQLITEPVTESTTKIRFSLCDDAESYSIVTPTGMDGSVNDQIVTGGEEVVVPVSPGGTGASSTLIVRNGPPISDDGTTHVGVHRYDVSISTVMEELVGAGNPLIGTYFQQVVYDMPSPQTLATYRQSPQSLPGGLEQYVAYGDELIEKWAMVKLTTCHASLASAVMADVQGFSGIVANMQLTAKVLRNRGWYIMLNSMREYMYMGPEISLCEPGVNGFNVFVEGIEKGFTPVQPGEVSTTKDPVALLKSFALLKFLGQVGRSECDAVEGVKIESSGVDLDEWTNAISEKLVLLSEDVDLTSAQRLTAKRALRQADTLNLLKDIRDWADADTKCSRLSAGYAVPVKQASVEVIEIAASTLPAPVEKQDQDSAAPTTVQPLAEVVTNPQPETTVAPAQLVWPEAMASVKPTLRVGQTVSKSLLVAQSGVVASSKSRVTLTPRSPKSICTVRSTGVKALKVGTCKVRVSVATKGKKTQTRNVSLTISS